MSIKIRNIRTFKPDGSITIKVDRSSPLGNPFKMGNDESLRDLVCNNYERYFDNTVRVRHTIFTNEVDRIVELAKTNDITLLCWCYPKRCHAETIKRHIEDCLKREGQEEQ